MKTRISNKRQFIDETSGTLSTSFKFNRKEVHESCGVTHENKHYIFGGNKNTRQILQLSDCSLTEWHDPALFHESYGQTMSTAIVGVRCLANAAGINL